jgi:menaquinone-dependent protoporphyrinogen oxidase
LDIAPRRPLVNRHNDKEKIVKILVTVASKHGATRGIAEAIAVELRDNGLIAEVYDADAAPAVDGYDAVIIGSAIYTGKWRPDARRFIERNQDGLARMPVWLFSSGPLGHDDPQPQGDPIDIGELLEQTRASDHRIFVGKLDTRRLGPVERLMVRMVKAPEGDFRDWDAIRAWAREIGVTLRPEAAAMPGQLEAQR